MNGDRVIRALTDDGAFRLIAACTTATVQGAISAQAATGDVARRFGELLTGAVLTREAMSPGHRLQAILRSADGRPLLVADAMPGGQTRGLVQNAKASLDFAGGQLQVVRSLNSGLHQGIVGLPREGATISASMMSYMHQSEQIVSMIAVSCLIDGAGRVRAAGGYLLQLLPEADRAALAIMTERLVDFQAIDPIVEATRADPDRLLGEIFHGMPHTKVEESGVSFGCGCSDLRVMSALSTLGRADIEHLIHQRSMIELSCDYCGTNYQIGAERLRALLAES